ncbi:MAG TPA: hypothetical protein PKE29_08935 [Phycisphaerales bacterium]|nr:hypothetical protein [Phycisphaerales bacterium]
MSPDDATSNPSPPNGGESSAPARSPPPASPLVGRELGGDLPCVFCGYNLRGLSVRSMCPECGAGVRATILSVVDPQASELRTIEWPRLTAAGIVLWAFGAVAVAMLSWLPQIADILQAIGVRGMRGAGRPSAGLGVMLGLATSALGALALIRPHAGIRARDCVKAALAVVLYIPLGVALWLYHLDSDSRGGPRYFSTWSPSREMCILLALAGMLIAIIIALQRPNARLLVARSMVMRTGRVDRQTLYAMAGAACVLSAGGLIGLIPLSATDPTIVEAARFAGVLAIALGGGMLSVGAVGSLLDSVRIAGAILIPKVTARQVIREGRPGPKSRVMKVIDPTPPPPRPFAPTPLEPARPADGSGSPRP